MFNAENVRMFRQYRTPGNIRVYPDTSNPMQDFYLVRGSKSPHIVGEELLEGRHGVLDRKVTHITGNEGNNAVRFYEVGMIPQLIGQPEAAEPDQYLSILVKSLFKKTNLVVTNSGLLLTYGSQVVFKFDITDSGDFRPYDYPPMEGAHNFEYLDEDTFNDVFRTQFAVGYGPIGNKKSALVNLGFLVDFHSYLKYPLPPGEHRSDRIYNRLRPNMSGFIAVEPEATI